MDYKRFGQYLGFIGLTLLIITFFYSMWVWNSDVSIDELIDMNHRYPGLEHYILVNNIRRERMKHPYWFGGVGIGLLILGYGIYSSSKNKD